MEERKIFVKDKNGKLLAEFSNMTPASTDESKKNLMVSPTIDIVSNGESTLSFQMLIDSEKWQQIKNPENLFYCNGRVYTALNEKSIVYSGRLATVTLVELWYLLKYKYIQAHNTDTSVEALDEHTVKILPKTDKKFKLTVNGVQYEDNDVRDSRGELMPRGSLGYAAWALLKGTDWKLGVCDVLPDGFDASKDYGTFNVESDMKSVLENLTFARDLYGGVFDWDSENKVLNIRDEEKDSDFNKWKGYSIRKEKNLASPPSITFDNDIITRLYPLGNGNLNIKKVNDGKSYVENFSYTDKVYEGYIQNPSIYDTNDEGGQRTLKFWAEQQLKKMCKPRMHIDYSVVDVRALESQRHENVDINDMAKCYFVDDSTRKERFEFLRVIHMQYDWFHPSSDDVIEVGDKSSNVVELFYQIYKQSEKNPKPDENGHFSGDDIYIELPESYWEHFGGGFGYGSLTEITKLHAYYKEETDQHILETESAVEVLADDLSAQVNSFTDFKKETLDSFTQSNTAINQISTELSAQITLEANHYKETTEGLAESNASIKLISDNLQSQITLEANHYNETTQKFLDTAGQIGVVNQRVTETNASLNVVANNLSAEVSTNATFRSQTTTTLNDKAGRQEVNDLITASETRVTQYVSGNYATISSLASYATNDSVNQKISSSEASIKQYAGSNFASITLSTSVANIDNRTKNIDTSAGYVSISTTAVQLGNQSGNTILLDGNSISLAASRIILNGGGRFEVDSDGSVSILGKKVQWVSGYLKSV